MTAYLISGQAADEKLFENLTLPAHISVKYVHWIEPFSHENLLDYCRRLSEQMDTSGDFVLIGVSLGGIVSVELNKILRPRKTIIISSVATERELGPFLHFISLTRLHKIVPAGFYKWHTPLLDWFFGAKTKREKALLKFYARSTTKNYMKWAVNEILNWKNKERPAHLVHIHGTADRIFPYRRTHADIKIRNGTHMMVHNRADEISRIISEILNADN